MSLETQCVFCRIVRGDEPAEMLYEDAACVAFLDRAPAAEGNTLVVPRAHSRSLPEMTPSEAGLLMSSVSHVARLLQAALAPDGLTMIQTNEEAGWQSVFHVHVHVVPRWSGDGLVAPWPVQPASSDSLAATRARILAGT